MDDFRKELTALLNRHSMENESNTPDYLLAMFLHGCLESWNQTVVQRDKWYGDDKGPRRASHKLGD